MKRILFLLLILLLAFSLPACGLFGGAEKATPQEPPFGTTDAPAEEFPPSDETPQPSEKEKETAPTDIDAEPAEEPIEEPTEEPTETEDPPAQEETIVDSPAEEDQASHSYAVKVEPEDDNVNSSKDRIDLPTLPFIDLPSLP